MTLTGIVDDIPLEFLGGSEKKMVLTRRVRNLNQELQRTLTQVSHLLCDGKRKPKYEDVLTTTKRAMQVLHELALSQAHYGGQAAKPVPSMNVACELVYLVVYMHAVLTDLAAQKGMAVDAETYGCCQLNEIDEEQPKVAGSEWEKKTGQLLDKLSQLYPHSTLCSVYQGWLLLRRGNPLKAEAVLQKCLTEASPSAPTPELFILLSLCYHHQGKQGKALEMINKCLAYCGKEEKWSTLVLVLVHIIRGELKKSITGSQADKFSIKAGRLDSGQKDDCISDYSKAIEMDGKGGLASTFVGRGLALDTDHLQDMLLHYCPYLLPKVTTVTSGSEESGSDFLSFAFDTMSGTSTQHLSSTATGGDGSQAQSAKTRRFQLPQTYSGENLRVTPNSIVTFLWKFLELFYPQEYSNLHPHKPAHSVAVSTPPCSPPEGSAPSSSVVAGSHPQPTTTTNTTTNDAAPTDGNLTTPRDTRYSSRRSSKLSWNSDRTYDKPWLEHGYVKDHEHQKIKMNYPVETNPERRYRKPWSEPPGAPTEGESETASAWETRNRFTTSRFLAEKKKKHKRRSSKYFTKESRRATTPNITTTTRSARRHSGLSSGSSSNCGSRRKRHRKSSPDLRSSRKPSSSSRRNSHSHARSHPSTGRSRSSGSVASYQTTTDDNSDEAEPTSNRSHRSKTKSSKGTIKGKHNRAPSVASARGRRHSVHSSPPVASPQQQQPQRKAARRERSSSTGARPKNVACVSPTKKRSSTTQRPKTAPATVTTSKENVAQPLQDNTNTHQQPKPAHFIKAPTERVGPVPSSLHAPPPPPPPPPPLVEEPDREKKHRRHHSHSNYDRSSVDKWLTELVKDQPPPLSAISQALATAEAPPEEKRAAPTSIPPPHPKPSKGRTTPRTTNDATPPPDTLAADLLLSMLDGTDEPQKNIPASTNDGPMPVQNAKGIPQQPTVDVEADKSTKNPGGIPSSGTDTTLPNPEGTVMARHDSKISNVATIAKTDSMLCMGNDSTGQPISWMRRRKQGGDSVDFPTLKSSASETTNDESNNPQPQQVQLPVTAKPNNSNPKNSTTPTVGTVVPTEKQDNTAVVNNGTTETTRNETSSNLSKPPSIQKHECKDTITQSTNIRSLPSDDEPHKYSHQNTTSSSTATNKIETKSVSDSVTTGAVLTASGSTTHQQLEQELLLGVASSQDTLCQVATASNNSTTPRRNSVKSAQSDSHNEHNNNNNASNLHDVEKAKDVQTPVELKMEFGSDVQAMIHNMELNPLQVDVAKDATLAGTGGGRGGAGGGGTGGLSPASSEDGGIYSSQFEGLSAGSRPVPTSPSAHLPVGILRERSVSPSNCFSHNTTNTKLYDINGHYIKKRAKKYKKDSSSSKRRPFVLRGCPSDAVPFSPSAFRAHVKSGTTYVRARQQQQYQQREKYGKWETSSAENDLETDVEYGEQAAATTTTMHLRSTKEIPHSHKAHRSSTSSIHPNVSGGSNKQRLPKTNTGVCGGGFSFERTLAMKQSQIGRKGQPASIAVERCGTSKSGGSKQQSIAATSPKAAIAAAGETRAPAPYISIRTQHTRLFNALLRT